MDWNRWAPRYRAILADFGWREADDEAARDLLASLLPSPPPPLDRLAFLEGADVTVLGAGASLERAAPPRGPVVAADSAVARALARGFRIDAVVTDLDGDVDAQRDLNAKGVPLVVHAHADNRAALEAWVPRFPGPVVGTCQCAPLGNVLNFGGFTDGDRACFLAEALGARRILLAGFDWDAPAPDAAKAARGPAKAAKLAWARRLLADLTVPVADAPRT
ncbi:MAG TPA: 6-hydroxymethylpterin diphosphokinase MptE-like protein [Candidatus Thermoplasmatota archaeon]|nr:6-hydroxymethylpterin diphosphokinase MptE-like protein [Candidatus Thermoplasmatota archaeon]